MGEQAAQITYNEMIDNYFVKIPLADDVTFIIEQSDNGYTAYKEGSEQIAHSLCRQEKIQGNNFIICKGSMGPLEVNFIMVVCISMKELNLITIK